jgi:hypothetical protein
MFGFDQASKVFIYAKPTDMRKGFDGLYGLVINHMDLDPRQGYLFVFLNRQQIQNVPVFLTNIHWQSVKCPKISFPPSHTSPKCNSLHMRGFSVPDLRFEN